MKNKKINDKCKMVNDKSAYNVPNDRPKFWVRCLVTTLMIVLIILLFFFLAKPLRTYSGNKYVKKGDSFLAEKKYLHADLAYQKALILTPKNKVVIAKRSLANKSSLDVSNLENFYKSNDLMTEQKKIDEARAFPQSQSDAVKLSKKLIEDKEYQLAIIPAKTATEMDPEYRDAWLYLGIANLKTAQLVELSADVQSKYLESAKEALEKAKKIDPESKAVSDYLKVIQTRE